jgi:hypothetical protein
MRALIFARNEPPLASFAAVLPKRSFWHPLFAKRTLLSSNRIRQKWPPRGRLPVGADCVI